MLTPNNDSNDNSNEIHIRMLSQLIVLTAVLKLMNNSQVKNGNNKNTTLNNDKHSHKTANFTGDMCMSLVICNTKNIIQNRPKPARNQLWWTQLLRNHLETTANPFEIHSKWMRNQFHWTHPVPTHLRNSQAHLKPALTSPAHLIPFQSHVKTTQISYETRSNEPSSLLEITPSKSVSNSASKSASTSISQAHRSIYLNLPQSKTTALNSARGLWPPVQSNIYIYICIICVYLILLVRIYEDILLCTRYEIYIYIYVYIYI